MPHGGPGRGSGAAAGGAGPGERNQEGGLRDRGEAAADDGTMDDPVVGAGDLDDVAGGHGTHIGGPGLAVVVVADPFVVGAVAFGPAGVVGSGVVTAV